MSLAPGSWVWGSSFSATRCSKAAFSPSSPSASMVESPGASALYKSLPQIRLRRFTSARSSARYRLPSAASFFRISSSAACSPEPISSALVTPAPRWAGTATKLHS